LTRARDPLARFLDEASALGSRLGPLLVQLPPSLAFESRRVGRFFELLRAHHSGGVVCEPRHPTWTTIAAGRMLERLQIARVAADPPRCQGLGEPGGWPGLVYYRWHGSPRPYFSAYGAADLNRLGLAAASARCDVWCVFDNTGSGSAAGNALDLAAQLAENPRSTASRAVTRLKG
jgi:uncharacterized protein YecE (DUF72 family)